MGRRRAMAAGPRTSSTRTTRPVGQTYAELYLLIREDAKIAPLRARIDAILSAPSHVDSLCFHEFGGRSPEKLVTGATHCLMGPPTWVRLYAATGERRYLDFAVSNWWRTTRISSMTRRSTSF